MILDYELHLGNTLRRRLHSGYKPNFEMIFPRGYFAEMEHPRDISTEQFDESDRDLSRGISKKRMEDSNVQPAQEAINH